MTTTSLATVRIDAHHSAYVVNGAITADPTLLPDYDADEPTPGTSLVVVDREGWGTLHQIVGRCDGKFEPVRAPLKAATIDCLERMVALSEAA